MFGPCSAMFSRTLLQHQHTPLHPLSYWHLSGGVWPELLRRLSRKHNHRLRRLHQHHAVQKCGFPPPRIDAAIKLHSIQRKPGVWHACVSLHRSAVRGRTGRFHRVHRVPQLPGELPSQCGVHLDHQPATQTQDPYCCSGNLLAHRGWVWGLLSNEKKL